MTTAGGTNNTSLLLLEKYRMDYEKIAMRLVELESTILRHLADYKEMKEKYEAQVAENQTLLKEHEILCQTISILATRPA